MRGSGDVSFSLWALALFAAWLFVGLPALYSPSHEGFLGVKLAEWLLIGATLALYVATRQLVIGAEKTAERQLRAYVMIKTVRLEGLKDDGCPRAIVTIKNSGNTPAKNVTHWAQMGFSTFPEMTLFPVRDSSRIMPPGAVAPGGKIIMSTGIDKPLNAPAINAIEKGTHAIYVVGEIRYEDAFGQTRETDFHLFCTRGMVAEGSMASFHTGNRIT
jgi:hypothetical protein